MKSVKNLLAALMLLSAPIAFAGGDAPQKSFGTKVREAALKVWAKTYGRLPGMSLEDGYVNPDCKQNEDGSYAINPDGSPVIETATGVKAKCQRFAHQHPTAVNRMKVGGAAGLTAALIAGGVAGVHKLVKSQHGKKAAAKIKALFKGEANKKAAPAAAARRAAPQAARGWKPNRNAGMNAGSCAGGRCAGGSCRR